jgi:hypothetical protein
MSAIGSYVLVRRDRLQKCVDLANLVRTEEKGKWIFKTKSTVGIPEFMAEWQAASMAEKAFDYSGYVLATYVIAQAEINGVKIESAEHVPVISAICKVFTLATLVEHQISLPAFDQAKLRDFCQHEEEDDWANLFEALQSAHLFYCDGLAHLSDDLVVVFLIR